MPRMPPRKNGQDPAGATRPGVARDCRSLEQNLEKLAYADTVDNGKPIRETLAADIPLTVDHFRYFAGCIRAQEGTLSEIDEIPSPTTSTSRSAWSVRSFPGTSPS